MCFRVVNICFAILFLVITSGTIATKCLSYCGVPFPDWACVGKDFSHLEGRAYENLPDLPAESISSAQFQTDFEQYLTDLTPMKDSAILLNARLQRLGIEMAAVPFGYKTYPTFFGSKHAYDSSTDAVVQTAVPSTDDAALAYEIAANAYVSFAERHEELGIHFYRVELVNSSANNPTHSYVRNSEDTDFLTEHFFDSLDDEINVIDRTFDSNESMVKGHFRTDHHWTIESAYTAYAKIMAELNSEALPAEMLERITWSEIPFYGSFSRAGLCLPRSADVISDYWFDLSGLTVSLDGEKSVGDSLDHYHTYAAGEQLEDMFINRYGEYYHSDYGLIEIHNSAIESGTLLVVADSYSNNLERFFLAHYQNVLVLDPRHTDLTLEDLLAEYAVDDVVFMLCSTTMGTERTVAALQQ